MSSQIVRFPAPGCVVEFMQGGRAVQAWVLGEQSGNLRLYTINKREMKLGAARLLPWSGPMYAAGASRAEIDERLDLARARREELARGLDLAQLWDLAQGEVPQADITWFAELVWPEPDVDHLAALGQAMLAQKTHFRFNPPYFEVFTAEEVAERAARQERAERLSELSSIGGEFFRRLLEAERADAPLQEAYYPAPALAEELKALLMARIADPDAHDPDNVWKIITKGLSAKGADDPFLPLRLALAWGIVPAHYNFYLDRAGYEDGDAWADAGVVSALAEAVAANLPKLPELSGGRAFVSVDPESTQDFDDALRVEEAPGGGWRVALAIACPAWLWPFGGAFDKQVLRRVSSLYLPEGSHFMLPRGLCAGSYSLAAGRERPVMLLEVNLDEDLRVLSALPRLGRLSVTANLSLGESEAALNGAADAAGAAAEHSAMLQICLRLARALRQKRLEGGAVITERAEQDIRLRVENGETVVEIAPAQNYENSQLIVGELMILANSALAAWAVERGLPLLYRTQIASLPKESAGVWTEPHDIHRVLRGMPPARMSTQPGPHAGVGAAAYSSLTAPMRRYADLLNQAQLISCLETTNLLDKTDETAQHSPGLDKSELDGLLPLIAARQDAVAQVQRYRTRYWKLVFLQQAEQRKKGLNYWEAVISDENNAFVTVVLRLTGLVLRGPRQLFGERATPGAAVGVRVGKINPMRNEIQIMEVVDY